MDFFTKTVVDYSQEAAREWLAELLKQKLDAQGITNPALLDALVQHAMNGGGDEFHFEDDCEDGNLDLNIEITEADLDDFRQLTTRITDTLSEAVENLSKRAARDVFSTLRKEWPERAAHIAASQAGFEERLYERWGEALDHLNMLHRMSLELGMETFQKWQRSKAKKVVRLREVLLRLHARACRTAAEVIALLEKGYADGAIARWRTLHEITVVATVIAEFGEAAAERYLDHEVVEAKRAVDTYSKTRIADGKRPSSALHRKNTDRAFDAVIQKYGKAFGGPYGWAAGFVPNPNPKFDHLEAAAGRAPARPHYKMASYNVHAGAAGLSARLGALSPGIMLPGASNAGLSRPGVLTAFALLQMNQLLLPDKRPTFMYIVRLRFLVSLREAATRAFERAERQLLKEEFAPVSAG